MLVYVTTKFDEMKQFFIDLGLKLESDHPSWAQVTPVFNQGRGCIVVFPSLWLSLEECTTVPPSGPLYMEIDVDEFRLLALQAKYSVKHEGAGICGGNCYRLMPPDGGIVMALAR